MAQGILDLTGQRFGRLTALSLMPKRRSEDATYWWCRCDCGVEKAVQRSTLRDGRAKSCGCLRAEWNSRVHRKHGRYGTPEYRAWIAMVQRCEDRNLKAFKDYGGRGITVCPRWRESFEAFYADMGDRPSELHSLDRFPNNNGNYEPGNVRWATWKEQANNRRPRTKTIHSV